MPELEAEASELGVRKRVRFIGHSNDLPEVLRAIDVLALPNEVESFPLILLKAMGVGGVSEAVVDGETGFIAPAGDPAAFGHAISR